MTLLQTGKSPLRSCYSKPQGEQGLGVLPPVGEWVEVHPWLGQPRAAGLALKGLS